MSEPIRVGLIRERAYRLMDISERKYGHRSAQHVVAWTIYGEVSDLARGIVVPHQAPFTNLGEMSNALDKVERSCDAKNPTPEQLAELDELARRPGIIASITNPCPTCGRRTL